MQQIVNLTVETDIPQYADMKASTARKIKQLLGVIAQSVPFKPGIESLAQIINASRNIVPDYLHWLERAGMIGRLRNDTGGIRGLGKIEKIFLDNPTLMTILSGDNADIGNLRETFFYNQMRVDNEVTSSKISDFRIGSYTFEIGERNKLPKLKMDIL